MTYEVNERHVPFFSTGVKDRGHGIFLFVRPRLSKVFLKNFFPQKSKVGKSWMLMKKIFCVFENREDLPFSESVVRMKKFFF